MSKKRKILKDLAHFYGVDLTLKSSWPDHATTDLVTNKVYMLYHDSIPLYQLLSYFFHELAHLYCKYSNKYPLFHTAYLERIPKSKRPYFLGTIWRAEKYVDNFGQRLMKSHFPSISYYKGYADSQKKTFCPIIQQTFKQYFKEVDSFKKKKS